MKLSENESKILASICRKYRIDIKVLKALMMAEYEGYYSNESQKNKIVPEMVDILEYWSKKHEESSD